MNKFNIRVYGLLINDAGKILLTDEEIDGFRFTKFPGGGLEHGEGIADALKREYLEECNFEITIEKHFYTTDFYVKSLFSDNEQLIAVYYFVQPLTDISLTVTHQPFDFGIQQGKHKQVFRWKNIKELKEEDLTFPVDKYVLNLLKNNIY